MRVAGIIQARMGSTRLPGKVLADIAGKPMLTRTIERVSRANTPTLLMVATTTSPGDDVLADHARRLGVSVFRGDENDVLDRLHRAAASCGADLVVRVTADCPLIDPDLIDRVVSALVNSKPRAAIAANIIQRSFPRGLDVECIWAADLVRLHDIAREVHQREHVFPYAYEHPDEFPSVSVADPKDRSWMRWTVDTPEDLEFVRRVTARLRPDEMSWLSVLELLDCHADWLEINRRVVQKSICSAPA